MVARRILVPPVRVRILPRQRKERAKSLRFSSFFFFILRANVKNCIFITIPQIIMALALFKYNSFDTSEIDYFFVNCDITDNKPA